MADLVAEDEPLLRLYCGAMGAIGRQRRAGTVGVCGALLLVACGDPGQEPVTDGQCGSTVEAVPEDLPELFTAWEGADFPTREGDPEAFSGPFEGIGEALNMEPTLVLTGMRDTSAEPWTAEMLGDLLVLHFPEGAPDGTIEAPTLAAFDLDTGDPVWGVQDSEQTFDHFPELVSDSVFVHASGDEESADLYSIDLQNGEILGCTPAPLGDDSVAAPAGAGDVVFTSSDGNLLTRLDVVESEVRWEVEVEDPELLDPEVSAAVEDDLIVLSSFRDPDSLAEDEDDGTDDIVDEDVETVAYTPRVSRAYGLDDGQLRWEYPETGSAYPADHAEDGHLLMIREASPEGGQHQHQSGFIRGDLLFGLEMVSLDGEQIWATDTEPATHQGRGTTVDDLVIWSDASLDGTTMALDVDTGQQRWEITDDHLAELSSEDTAGIVASQYTVRLDDMLLVPSASAINLIGPQTGEVEYIDADLGGTTRLKTIGATGDHMVIAPTHFSDNQALSFVIYHR